MCLKHSGGMDSVALAVRLENFEPIENSRGGIPAYYWVPFCIPKIIILPGDQIFSWTYLKVKVMDPAEHSSRNKPKNMFFG